jgi:hypothetical protein
MLFSTFWTAVIDRQKKKSEEFIFRVDILRDDIIIILH